MQVGFQYKAGRASSVTDLAAFTQSLSPHSWDSRLRKDQAFNPCQVCLPLGPLEGKLQTESFLQSQQSMIFPNKAQIPLVLFALVRPSVSFSIGQKEHHKHMAAARLFHHVTFSACIPWSFSISHFPQQLAVTQASPAEPGAGSVHPPPWQHRAPHSTQSTAASTPEIPIHHLGKHKLLNLRADFPEESQGQALGNMLNLAPSSKCPNTKTF